MFFFGFEGLLATVTTDCTLTRLKFFKTSNSNEEFVFDTLFTKWKTFHSEKQLSNVIDSNNFGDNIDFGCLVITR